MNAGYRKNEGIAVHILGLILVLMIAVIVFFLIKPYVNAFFASQQYELITSWGWLPVGSDW